MIVKVNTEALEKEKKIILNNLEVYDDFVNRIADTVEKTQLIWQDEASKNFQNKMSDFIEELKNFRNQIDSYSAFLEGYTDCINNLETVYNNKQIRIE